MNRLLLPLTAGLSVLLAMLTGRAALSNPNSLRTEFPRTYNPEVYKPICYMETDGGIVLNLESVCESDDVRDTAEQKNNNDSGSVTEESPEIPTDGLPPQQEINPPDIEITPEEEGVTGEGIEVPTEGEEDIDESGINIPTRQEQEQDIDESDINIPTRQEQEQDIDESGINIPTRQEE